MNQMRACKCIIQSPYPHQYAVPEWSLWWSMYERVRLSPCIERHALRKPRQQSQATSSLQSKEYHHWKCTTQLETSACWLRGGLNKQITNCRTNGKAIWMPKNLTQSDNSINPCTFQSSLLIPFPPYLDHYHLPPSHCSIVETTVSVQSARIE